MHWNIHILTFLKRNKKGSKSYCNILYFLFAGTKTTIWIFQARPNIAKFPSENSPPKRLVTNRLLGVATLLQHRHNTTTLTKLKLNLERIINFEQKIRKIINFGPKKSSFSDIKSSKLAKKIRIITIFGHKWKKSSILADFLDKNEKIHQCLKKSSILNKKWEKSSKSSKTKTQIAQIHRKENVFRNWSDSHWSLDIHFQIVNSSRSDNLYGSFFEMERNHQIWTDYLDYFPTNFEKFVSVQPRIKRQICIYGMEEWLSIWSLFRNKRFVLNLMP